jgi:hypothetical protein
MNLMTQTLAALMPGDECEEAEKQIKTDQDQEDWFINCDYKSCVACWDEAKELNEN